MDGGGLSTQARLEVTKRYAQTKTRRTGRTGPFQAPQPHKHLHLTGGAWGQRATHVFESFAACRSMASATMEARSLNGGDMR